MAVNKHISIGRTGEDIAAGYLENRGFSIKTRNYRKKWGELDIVAEKDNVLHFVEVKAGAWCGDFWPQEGQDLHRPEDHMHTNKLERMARAIRTYLSESGKGENSAWTADLVVVHINDEQKKAQVRILHNILL